jgi:hypothetical protein
MMTTSEFGNYDHIPFIVFLFGNFAILKIKNKFVFFFVILYAIKISITILAKYIL